MLEEETVVYQRGAAKVVNRNTLDKQSFLIVEIPTDRSSAWPSSRCGVEAPSARLLLCCLLAGSEGGWITAQKLFLGFFKGRLAIGASP